MLSKEDNERITRVGPGTIMGKVMRRYWMPALLSNELPEAGGEPVHIELLGENFVAFRDQDGNVGLLDEACPHRGASLAVGRVEGNGIRCLYHGWKFAVDGTVLETPNVADPKFKTQFKARSYPVKEAGGMVWAYVGEPGKEPPLPDFAFNSSPDEMRMTQLALIPANYVQVVEGLLDSSHLTILHQSALSALAQANDSRYAQVTSKMKDDASPRVESDLTEFGLHYVAIRETEEAAEMRVAAFWSPIWTFNPNGDIFIGMVPLNDEMTAMYHIWYDGESKFGLDPLKTQTQRSTGLEDRTLIAYGMTRSTYHGENRMGRANGFRQDRAALKQGHFTGMPPICQEDALMTVSSGAIRDRSKERLAQADIAIVNLYRALLECAKAVEADREPPFWGQSIAGIMGTNQGVAIGTDWRSLVPTHKLWQVRH